MLETIQLNKQQYVMKESDLPALITYGEKMGGSHLSIAMVAQLYSQASKILFLTAYPMAKDDFLQQIGQDHSKIAFVNSIEELETAHNSQVIILESGNEALFLDVVKSLSDLTQRVILVKNMEVFTNAVFSACLEMEKIIISGNLDACVAKDKISAKKFKTIIAFNQPETPLPIVVPELEKYSGFLSNGNTSGIITIKK